jgi:hypothetical protein
MSICLVEIKKEFTIHLVNLLNPLIYEGVQSIYDRALNCCEPTVLKTFQEFLSEIKNWNQQIIDNEYLRIKEKMPSYFDSLLKATIEANISLLTSYNIQNNTRLPVNIDTKNFIHLIYIEAAREFYNNPILLYHKYTTAEIKKNQFEAINIIKHNIHNAIRKILPMETIINKYLSKFEKLEETYNTNNDIKKDNNTKKDNDTPNINPSLKINLDLIDKIEQKIYTDKKSMTSETSKIGSQLPISEIDNKKLPVSEIDNKKLESAFKVLGGSDTDMHTDVHYTPENNPNNYQEIYNNNNPTYFQSHNK